MTTPPISFAFIGWPDLGAIVVFLFVLALALSTVVIIVQLVSRGPEEKSPATSEPGPAPIGDTEQVRN